MQRSACKTQCTRAGSSAAAAAAVPMMMQRQRQERLRWRAAAAAANAPQQHDGPTKASSKGRLIYDAVALDMDGTLTKAHIDFVDMRKRTNIPVGGEPWRCRVVSCFQSRAGVRSSWSAAASVSALSQPHLLPSLTHPLTHSLTQNTRT